MKRKLTNEQIKQNLEDAGCDVEMIDCILESCNEGDEKKMKELLSKHRRKLVDEMHKSCRCIDCLDYLSYEIEKQKKD